MSTWVKKQIKDHKTLCESYLASKKQYDSLAKAVVKSHAEYPVRKGCSVCNKIHVVPRKVRAFVCSECADALEQK